MDSSASTASDAMIRRYLLGQLSSEEQSSLEERFFSDDGYFGHVELAEDELIKSYVHGELPGTDRQAFEAHFLNTPERRFRLVATRALQESVAEAPSVSVMPQRARWHFLSRPSSFWMTAAAASLVVWLGVTTYLWQQLSQQRTTAAARRQESEQQIAARDTRITELERQLQYERAARPPTPIRPDVTLPGSALFSFLLTPNAATRGEQPRSTTLTIPSTATLVELQLGLKFVAGEAYESYRAILETSGSHILTIDGLKSARRGRSVSLMVPAELLQPGQYRITLSGRRARDSVEEVDDYLVRVVRR